MRFYRIDNQWGNIFKDNPLLRTKEVGFLMTLIFIVFKLLYWFIKFIIYCALLSLILNCMYHWRDVMEWFL